MLSTSTGPEGPWLIGRHKDYHNSELRNKTTMLLYTPSMLTANAIISKSRPFDSRATFTKWCAHHQWWDSAQSCSLRHRRPGTRLQPASPWAAPACSWVSEWATPQPGASGSLTPAIALHRSVIAGRIFFEPWWNSITTCCQEDSASTCTAHSEGRQEYPCPEGACRSPPYYRLRDHYYPFP
jgi:hypothetical protein